MPTPSVIACNKKSEITQNWARDILDSNKAVWLYVCLLSCVFVIY